MTCKFVKGQKYAYKSSPNHKIWEFVGFTENNALALFCATSRTSAVRLFDGTCPGGISDYDIISDEMTDTEKNLIRNVLVKTGNRHSLQLLQEGEGSCLAESILEILRSVYGRKE